MNAIEQKINAFKAEIENKSFLMGVTVAGEIYKLVEILDKFMALSNIDAAVKEEKLSRKLNPLIRNMKKLTRYDEDDFSIDQDTIEFRDGDSVACIRINEPDTGNMLQLSEVSEAIVAQLEVAQAQTEVRNETAYDLHLKGQENTYQIIVKESMSLRSYIYNEHIKLCQNDEFIQIIRSEVERVYNSHPENMRIEFLDKLLRKGMDKLVSTEAPDEANLIKFIEIWLESLGFLSKKQIEDNTKKLIGKLLRLEKNHLDKIVSEHLISKLISMSEEKPCAFDALKILFGLREVRNLQRSSSMIDTLIIDSINSNALSRQAPYSHFLLYAFVIRDAFSNNRAGLASVLKKLNFQKHNPPILARAFFEAMIINDPRTSRVALESMTDSLQLSYFCNKDVVAGFEGKMISALNGLMESYFEEKGIATRIMEKEQAIFSRGNNNAHLFLSIPFLYLTRALRDVKECVRDKFTWCRILFFAGTNTSQFNQIDFCTKLRAAGNEVQNSSKKSLTDLAIGLGNFYAYYHDNYIYQKEYRELYTLLADKLVLAVFLTKNKDIEGLATMTLGTISHFVGVDKSWLNTIFEFRNKPLGSYESGFSAVKEIFSDAMKGSDPENWSTHNLSERIFFLYCYSRYPIEDYKTWFTESNRDLGFSTESYIEEKLFDKLEENIKALPGYDLLPELGYKVLQNSQKIAIRIATDPDNEKNHVFSKVGTGQGKSLIIAMTALHHAKKGRKIHIFTCYKHLAERDFKRFKPLYEKCGIKSSIINNSGDDLDNDVQIIYSDMSTFCLSLYDKVDRKIQNNNRSMSTFEHLAQNMVILDEFDSLILDHDQVGNTVYNYREFFGLSSIEKSQLNANSFKHELISKHQLDNFFGSLDRNGFASWYGNWFANGSWAQSRTSHDRLGKNVSYTGGTLWELTQGNFYIKRMYIHVLAFLKKYNRIIGFSGSIDSNNIKRFEKLFTTVGKKVSYFDIPPFFGLKESRNRQIKDINGLSDQNWEQKIADDVKRAVDASQPILVFADINNQADWNRVKSVLQQAARNHGRNFQEISSESHVTDRILSKTCEQSTITLASHVVGRGADFVIQPEVLRQSEGLHVLLTYLPVKSSAIDRLMIVQMIGRTARMENTGTYSLISKQTLREPSNDPITIAEASEKYHLLATAIYNKIKDRPYAKTVWIKWLLLNLFFDNSTQWPNSLNRFNNVNAQADFIVNNIIQPPRGNLAINSNRLFSANPAASTRSTDTTACTPACTVM